ncbi:MAG: LuxR C-terminal-related transcriptional regulator, partial [Anaerolineae bacterium]
RRRARTGWLSLDASDNDPSRFLAYFIAALQTIEANIGQGALSALQSPQPPPTEAVLTSLLNEITAIPDRIVLVLDDYHMIEAQPIDDALTFLFEHLPVNMHLVIATREDPHLPWARLRAHGQLTELRATDLRFTSSEAAEFLNQVMGLDLSAEDIATLETRTEGWIAGLQLAAISMQGSKDATGFIKSFTGSHRYVLDYLIEEVLEQQSESVQAFLLQTAVLDRMTGSLCDALTGQDNGQATLETLERTNLFIVPLDEERRWYRYHHLFADLLRQRLRQIHPEQVSTLHRQAGTWYENQGLADEALRHIFTAGDFQWAGRLVEQIGTATLWKRSDLASLLYWLERLPEEVVHSRPKLCLLAAWAMYGSGQPEVIDPFLRSAESHLQDAGNGPVARDDRLTETTETTWDVPPLSGDVQSMIAEVSVIRAFTTRARGDLPRAIELFHRALELLPSTELHLRAVAAGGLADAHYVSGDILTAGSLFPEASAIGWEGGNIYMASFSVRRLAEVQAMQGYLHQAADTYQQMLQLLARRGELHATVAGNAYVGMGAILCEWNDLDAAVQQLREGIERGKQGVDTRILLPGYVALTRALQGLGDAAGALAAIQEAMQLWQHYQATRLWSVPPVPTYQARLWLAQGDVASAAQWAQEQGLRADGEFSYQREVDYLTLARLLIAQGNANQAAGLLERLLGPAETGGRTTRVIEILMLQALAFQVGDETDQATIALEKALTLAEPGGFVRIFVDEGPPMAHLLYEAVTRGIAPGYARRLLAAFPMPEPEQDGSPNTQAPGSGLIEPLSERELEVLHLIAEGLTNPEIASRFFLSLHTIKVHTRNIYGKLGVHNRTQAVARARALGILPSI